MIPMTNFKSFLGLNWNPFLSEKPVDSFYEEENLSQFCWNVEQIICDGGFAFLSGDPGAGKSTAMRILQHRLNKVPELCVRIIDRPQSSMRDFYRELAMVFGVEIRVSNKYNSFQKLREQWLHIIHTQLFRPVLIIDEAQYLPDEVLEEVRFLGSADLDSRCILAVVFAGDSRLLQKFKSPEVLPLYSRMRASLILGNRTPEEMKKMLVCSLKNAGNPDLISNGVIKALSEQYLGNPRAMMLAANQLLMLALQKEVRHIDENLYFEATHSHITKKRQ